MRDLDIIGLIVTALATWQAVEVAHHGEIFALARAVAEARQRWVDRLFLCPYCLSVWTAPILVAVWLAPMPALTRAVSMFAVIVVVVLFKLFVLGLAVSRLANLANDLARPVTRTPNRAAPIKEARPKQYE